MNSRRITRYSRSISAAMLALTLITCALAATGCGKGNNGTALPNTQTSISAASESSNSPAAESAAASTSSKPASATDVVEVSKTTLGQDAIGRYFISTTVTNNGSESLDVDIDAEMKLTEREINKYGEEEKHVTIESLNDFDAVTPWVFGGDGITILNLNGGESREIVVYPTRVGSAYLSSTDYTIDDLDLSIESITPTSGESKLRDVPDFDGELSVEILSFDGKKVSGTVTNNTGKYLDDATMTFTKHDSNDIPISDNSWSSDRPVGADLVSETVRNLKPGAVADFDVYLGDCNTVKLKNVYYNVDQAKS